jgi:hypothetical protein
LGDLRLVFGVVLDAASDMVIGMVKYTFSAVVPLPQATKNTKAFAWLLDEDKTTDLGSIDFIGNRYNTTIQNLICKYVYGQFKLRKCQR